jgi:hypothetical protein
MNGQNVNKDSSPLIDEVSDAADRYFHEALTNFDAYAPSCSVPISIAGYMLCCALIHAAHTNAQKQERPPSRCRATRAPVVPNPASGASDENPKT